MKKATLYKETDRKVIEELFKKLKDDEVIFNPDGIKCGKITEIVVNDKKNSDGQAYQQIQFNVRGLDNKLYNKKYSVDFTRKLLKQMDIKAVDTKDAIIVFKPTGRFNGIGWFAFISYDEEGKFTLTQYEDEGKDYSTTLEKLGL